MNTDRLIEMLSVDPDPVKRRQLRRTLTVAIVVGGAAAFALMLLMVGPRHDLESRVHLEWVAVKLLFSLSIVGIGVPLLNKSVRPGLEDKTNWAMILFPFIAAIVVAVAVVLGQPRAWREMLRGATTVSPLRCQLFIIVFAAVPLTSVIYFLRQGAPTRLKLCGAIAGIVAGGLGATAYAFNCTSDSIPFIAIWYGTAIALCAVIGAQLGPRVLRW
jgi:hypothetical protein